MLLKRLSCNKQKFDKVKSCIFSFRSSFCSLVAMNLHKHPVWMGVLALHERQRKQRRETQRPFGSSLTFIKGLKSTLYSLSANEVTYSHKDPLSGMKEDQQLEVRASYFFVHEDIRSFNKPCEHRTSPSMLHSIIFVMISLG